MSTAPKVLDGKWLAQLIQSDIAHTVAEVCADGRRKPGLGVILVGEDPASKAYVASKGRYARACGCEPYDTFLPVTASFDDVRAAIRSFNEDVRIDGILLQLPLPKAIAAHTETLLALIDPAKDADGLHPLNQGYLVQGQPGVRPCTPRGVMALLDLALTEKTPAKFAEIEPQLLNGKKAVVIGRSVLVGKPVALLLLERNATVTIAHSKTADIASVCRDADIIVAAVGIPHLVRADWVSQGAIVLDVGINRIADGRLTGDVAYDEVAPKCAAITPVPGGVGPMTVAMLIHNTLTAFLKRHGVANEY